MNNQPCFLAIDSGTSRMKAALFDESNRLIDMVSADLRVLHPFDGASEADMDDTWEVLCALLRSLARRNPENWDAVAGVGVTGQGDGVWMVDGNGRPARNAILWNDTRTKSTAINDKGALERYCQDHSISACFQGANYYILKWVKENEPQVFSRIDKAVHCKDWLSFKMTGNLVTDFSDSSTSMLNGHRMQYDFKLLEFVDLEGNEEFFAPNHYSDEISGEVSDEAAIQTGLRSGIPVITGSIDVAAVAAGAGAIEPGDTVAIVGTTCCVTMVLEKSQLDYSDNRGSILCHLVRDRYLRLMAMSNGTASLDWVRKTVLPEASFDDIEQQISTIEVGSEGVIFQPYLYGERAPFRDATACGAFLGITARHTPLYLIKASYEGLAISLAQCYEALPQSDSAIYIAGGGAASDGLCQIISDCIGKTLVRPHISELGLHGILRSIRKGVGNLMDDDKAQAASADRFTPHEGNHKRYIELMQLYKESVRTMDSWWHVRAGFLNK